MAPPSAYAKTGTESRLTFFGEHGRVAIVLALLKAFAGALLSAFKPRGTLVMENLALRQQLAILRRATPRPKLRSVDRAFWAVLSRTWSRWPTSLRSCNQRRWSAGRHPPSIAWGAFLRAHLAGTIAVDFLVVPTVTFNLLYVFFVLSLERRRLLLVKVTAHPYAAWTAQQIVEAVGFDTNVARLIRDRDGIYGAAFDARVNNLGIRQIRSAPRSPWQNGYAERFVGTLRREVLDHVIVLGERHPAPVGSTPRGVLQRRPTAHGAQWRCAHPAHRRTYELRSRCRSSPRRRPPPPRCQGRMTHPTRFSPRQLLLG